MANNVIISDAVCSAMCDAFVDLLNTGHIRMYDTPQPDGPGTAISTQTLLAELDFANPAFGAASSGVATAETITGETDAPDTGTVAWARFVQSDDTAVLDCTVGTSGCDINLNAVAIVEHATVDITALTVTQPAS